MRLKQNTRKEARGRGNQGDWAGKQSTGGGERKEHREWNEEVERQKRAKKSLKLKES